MTKLVLFGSGGFARELCAWLPRSNLADLPLAGVMNDSGMPPAHLDWTVPYLGTLHDREVEPDDVFICAIGQPEGKQRTVELLRVRNATFATLIHDTAIVGPRVEIGEGSVLCPHVIVTADVRIGRHVLLNVMSSVGHDACIGDYATLSGHCDVTGNATLGEGAFLGTHTCVAPNRKVGDWSRVGAGSVVVRDVPRGETVFGNPAQSIRRRRPTLDS